ncbi:MAG: hypothetical protein IT463_03205 [Planctomycetes bacterium]|nr:hypothetical protein [Planctomycetota bacterium]
MHRNLAFKIQPQPDSETCGATCLQAVYAYHGLELLLPEVIAGIERLETGGTLGVMLARDALRRGFAATIYSYNLHMFDPTWFVKGVNFREKLLRQAALKSKPKLQQATRAYLDFFELGGKVRFRELRPALIRGLLNRGLPILTGLSATYLYRCARENMNGEYDDVGGRPSGHFVVICGYNKRKRLVRVADPWRPNPFTGDDQFYDVTSDRLISAILLSIVTYDANLLVIEPRRPRKAAP